MLAANPDLTEAEVRAILVSSATPMTALQCGRPTASDCGAGLLNANAALGGSPAAPWPDAPEALLELYVCDDPACTSVPDEPYLEFETTLQRGYGWVELEDLPVGTYYLYGEVNTPIAHPALQSLWDFRVFEIVAGETTTTIIEGWPSP